MRNGFVRGYPGVDLGGPRSLRPLVRPRVSDGAKGCRGMGAVKCAIGQALREEGGGRARRRRAASRGVGDTSYNGPLGSSKHGRLATCI